MNWDEILEGGFIQEHEQGKLISKLHKFSWSHFSALIARSLISGDSAHVSA